VRHLASCARWHEAQVPTCRACPHGFPKPDAHSCRWLRTNPVSTVCAMLISISPIPHSMTRQVFVFARRAGRPLCQGWTGRKSRKRAVWQTPSSQPGASSVVIHSTQSGRRLERPGTGACRGDDRACPPGRLHPFGDRRAPVEPSHATPCSRLRPGRHGPMSCWSVDISTNSSPGLKTARPRGTLASSATRPSGRQVLASASRLPRGTARPEAGQRDRPRVMKTQRRRGARPID